MTTYKVASSGGPYDFAANGHTVGSLPLPVPHDDAMSSIAWLLEGYSFALSSIFCETCSPADDIDLNALLNDDLQQVRDWEGLGDMPVECDSAQQARLASALGLHRIDEFVRLLGSGESGLALVLGWDSICDAHMEAVAHYRDFRMGSGPAERSRLARLAANARHASSPYATAKAFVKECWSDWDKRPEQYPSVAAFSRAMADKLPDVLKSTVSVERWVREWRRTEGDQ